MNSRLIGITLTVSFGILTSCSSPDFERPESIESKMARYKARDLGQNKVPQIDVSKTVVEDPEFQRSAAKTEDSTSSADRAPASLVGNEDTKSFVAKDYSNKRLYFLTLHSQFKELKQYVGVESVAELNSCPSFHTSFVGEKERELIKEKKTKQHYSYRPSAKMTAEKLRQKNFISLYPELQLSITNEAQHPTVAEHFQNRKDPKDSPRDFKQELQKKVEKALAVHVEQTYHELKELCEYGTSGNYYTYENLVGHTQRQKVFKPNAKNMRVLLKTTLFSNMAIISSLRERREKLTKSGRSIASTQELSQDEYVNETQARAQSKWIVEYFQQMIERR